MGKGRKGREGEKLRECEWKERDKKGRNRQNRGRGRKEGEERKEGGNG